ncbi:GNAT family N-acetyltransferase [Sinorhizobium meliloti]|uniref:GNAT family N-acetyltransferase n=1 Tax=Rhizobium meliloti TaxID=382 RepID=UPI0003125D7D|nr:GNAT family N-acetyltransferase [Sinorhizobium meliloti]
MKSPSQIADSESDQHTAEVPYRVHFYENCSQSPASRLVPQAMIEIKEIEGRGFHDRPHASPIFTGPCVAAIDEDGRAIGLILYCGEEIWTIYLSYVVLEHRRKHIHTALFKALRDKGLQQGNIVSIDCSTHVNNLAAQAAFEAQGRTKEYITYTYPLKDRRDGKGPTAEEMRMPEYLVERFDTGSDTLKFMQAFINKKAAEGYALHQAIERSTYQWVLIFKRADQA